MKKHFLLAAVCLALVISAVPVLAQETHTFTITVAPPAPQQEEVPAPPAEHLNWVWHPGYYRWDNDSRSYAWVHGEYVARPEDRPQAVWIAGRWDRQGNNYVWVEGHWQ